MRPTNKPTGLIGTGFAEGLNYYASKACFVSFTANPANEADMGVIGFPGIGNHGAEAASKVDVCKLETPTSLVGREVHAITAQIARITNTLELANSTDWARLRRIVL